MCGCLQIGPWGKIKSPLWSLTLCFRQITALLLQQNVQMQSSPWPTQWRGADSVGTLCFWPIEKRQPTLLHAQLQAWGHHVHHEQLSPLPWFCLLISLYEHADHGNGENASFHPSSLSLLLIICGKMFSPQWPFGNGRARGVLAVQLWSPRELQPDRVF